VKHSTNLLTSVSRGPCAVAELFVNFDARNHISRTAEARVAKFYVQVEYIKC